MANLVRTISNSRVGHYIFSCIDCGTEYTRSVNGKHINPYCAECSRKYQRQRQKEQAEAKQRKHDAELIDKFAEMFIAEGKKRKYLRHIWIENTCNKIAEQLKQKS